MDYKNPVDVELINSCTELYGSMQRMCEHLNVSPDNLSSLLRMKNAMNNARTELQLKEEDDRADIVSAVLPPSSMD